MDRLGAQTLSTVKLFFGGRNQHQISELLHISESSVHRRLRQAFIQYPGLDYCAEMVRMLYRLEIPGYRDRRKREALEPEPAVPA